LGELLTQSEEAVSCSGAEDAYREVHEDLLGRAIKSP
jgi:hypothetical protein